MIDERLRVFVVDDEVPARNKVLRFLASDSSIDVVGQAGDGAEALRNVAISKPDLLLIDIQMPGMDGFTVIEKLRRDVPRQIVFITAHDEFAIKAFQIHAFGYLLKPFDQKRFSKVMEDAKLQRREASSEAQLPSAEALLHAYRQNLPPASKLLIEKNGRGFFLSLEDVEWAETERNYVRLHVGERTHIVRGTLDTLQNRLDRSKYLRINRSCLVRFDAIRELHKWSHGEFHVLLTCGETRTWTRRYVNQNADVLCRLS